MGYLWNGAPTLLLTTTGPQERRAPHVGADLRPRRRRLPGGRVDGRRAAAPVVVPQPHREPRRRDPGEGRPHPGDARAPRPTRRSRGSGRSSPSVWPNYDVYQTRTDREIPVVVLSPSMTVGRRRPPLTWAERAADRSPAVQRSRARQIEQAQADRRRRPPPDRRTRRRVHDAGAGEGGRRRAPDLLPALRGQGPAAARGLRGPDRRELRRLRGGGARRCRIRSRGCTSTSPRPCGGRQRRRATASAPLRHRRALAAPPAVPGGDGRTPRSTSPTWSQRQLEARGRARGCSRSSDPQRDAWFVTKLVMARVPPLRVRRRARPMRPTSARNSGRSASGPRRNERTAHTAPVRRRPHDAVSRRRPSRSPTRSTCC